MLRCILLAGLALAVFSSCKTTQNESQASDTSHSAFRWFYVQQFSVGFTSDYNSKLKKIKPEDPTQKMVVINGQSQGAGGTVIDSTKVLSEEAFVAYLVKSNTAPRTFIDEFIQAVKDPGQANNNSDFDKVFYNAIESLHSDANVGETIGTSQPAFVPSI